MIQARYLLQVRCISFGKNSHLPNCFDHIASRSVYNQDSNHILLVSFPQNNLQAVCTNSANDALVRIYYSWTKDSTPRHV